ncbi:MAG: 50S ribosomal protein L29 [Bacteroidota bacterium]
MKAFEFRKLSDTELQKRIQEEQENLSNLQFQKVIGQLENPMKLGHIRKDIARMKTILQERKTAPVAPQPETEQPKA